MTEDKVESKAGSNPALDPLWQDPPGKILEVSIKVVGTVDRLQTIDNGNGVNSSAVYSFR